MPSVLSSPRGYGDKLENRCERRELSLGQAAVAELVQRRSGHELVVISRLNDYGPPTVRCGGRNRPRRYRSAYSVYRQPTVDSARGVSRRRPGAKSSSAFAAANASAA